MSNYAENKQDKNNPISTNPINKIVQRLTVDREHSQTIQVQWKQRESLQ
jgi:hypothetical protein